jgi:hypothetical protein
VRPLGVHTRAPQAGEPTGATSLRTRRETAKPGKPERPDLTV